MLKYLSLFYEHEEEIGDDEIKHVTETATKVANEKKRKPEGRKKCRRRHLLAFETLCLSYDALFCTTHQPKMREGRKSFLYFLSKKKAPTE